MKDLFVTLLPIALKMNEMNKSLKFVWKQYLKSNSKRNRIQRIGSFISYLNIEQLRDSRKKKNERNRWLILWCLFSSLSISHSLVISRECVYIKNLKLPLNIVCKKKVKLIFIFHRFSTSLRFLFFFSLTFFSSFRFFLTTII